MSDPISILAAGDVGAKRVDLDSMFHGCREVIKGADLAFGQLETVISDGGAVVPNARLAMRAPSEMAAAASRAGFDIMSFAGNHCLDWGYEAFGDTFRHAAAAGLRLCGAGPDIAAARRPAIVDVNGTRIAIVAASSILPEGYAAGENKPGCAPLRAHNVYEQIEHDQPGTPARTRTYPNREDLAALCDTIRSTAAEADIVLLSVHWGLHMIEAVLADYQCITAHAAIDAGADAVLGHHPHILKGVEIYKDRPIFYSLGNFAIEQPHIWDPAIVETASFRHLVSLNPQWDLASAYMLPDDTRLTGLARLRVRDGRLETTEFLPAFIEDDGAPRMLKDGDPEFDRVQAYLERVTRAAGFATRFERTDGALRLV